MAFSITWIVLSVYIAYLLRSRMGLLHRYRRMAK
ncbi:hypothetical protein [Methanolobus profundi]